MEIRRQKEIEAFQAMEEENKRQEAERQKMEEAYAEAMERMQIKLGKVKPRPKYGPAKPEWLKNKDGKEKPAEPPKETPDKETVEETVNKFVENLFRPKGFSPRPALTSQQDPTLGSQISCVWVCRDFRETSLSLPRDM